MKTYILVASMVLTSILSTSIFAKEPNTNQAKLLLNLPDAFNTPDGAALNPKTNDIILSIPNFNNQHLIDSGKLKTPSPAVMARLDVNNKISTWYTFKPEDMHADTGKIGPMDAAFGPDGNLYVADMQIFWDGKHKSRLLRINIKDDKPVSMDVVATGFIVANGLTWKDDTLFVSETILAHTPKVAEGVAKPALESGVYAFELSELQGATVKLKAATYGKNDADEHLVMKLTSSNRLGFGADGVTIDAAGNLYTAIVEDGIIYKTKLDDNNQAISTEVFAKDEQMQSADGIIYNPADENIYVAGFLTNSVHAVDNQGKVSTLHRNGDTDGADGSLDQPCEVIIRDGKLIIVNMDMAWAVPAKLQVDTKVDSPYTLSVINLTD